MIAKLPIFKAIGVTQGCGGTTSHIGLKAIDFGWNSSIKDSTCLYAPFDGSVVAKIGNTNTIAFESDEKVEYADGTIDYMTIITCHDNNAPQVGEHFEQGELYSHMGTAGNVAKHCHLEVQKGKYQKYTKIAKTGQYNSYIFPNTLYPYEVLYIDKDAILRPSAMYDWIREPVEEDDYKKKYNDLVIDYRALEDEYNILNGKYGDCIARLNNIREEATL